MTPQEIFDTVAVHLFKQGKQSIGEFGNCAYKGENGSMCAVGCLIQDYYEPKMDCMIETDIETVYHRFKEKLPKWVGDNLKLLNYLQMVHDAPENWNPVTMKSALYEVVADFNLDSSVLDTLEKFGE